MELLFPADGLTGASGSAQRPPERSRTAKWKRMLVPVLAVAVCGLLHLALVASLGHDTSYLVFVAAVAVTTHYAGWKIAAATTIVCSLAGAWIFAGAFPWPGSVRQVDVVEWLVFMLASALVIGAICVPRKEDCGRLKANDSQRDSAPGDGLSTLAGGIAHTFNNLLMVIRGSAELAGRRLPESSPVIPNLQRIEAAATRGAQVCEQLLAYSGATTFVAKPVHLTELVEKTAAGLSRLVPIGAALELRFASRVPRILGDPDQLAQLVKSLVTNAAEALGETHGTILIEVAVQKVAAGELHVASTAVPLPGGRYVVLRVSDTGCGMDPDTLTHLFDPFFTTKFAGRGLGLSSVLGIARRHGAALRMQSAPDRGSSFELLFPVAQVWLGAAPWLASRWRR